MYTTLQKLPTKTTIKINQSYRGETIEHKVQRIMQAKEPITDGAPLIYTERKDGVNPAHDIRTDKWDIAIEAMDTVAQAQQARRQKRIDDKKEQKSKQGGETPQSNTNTSQGTDA